MTAKKSQGAKNCRTAEFSVKPFLKSFVLQENLKTFLFFAYVIFIQIYTIIYFCILYNFVQWLSCSLLTWRNFAFWSCLLSKTLSLRNLKIHEHT